jgi:hypothetical protein
LVESQQKWLNGLFTLHCSKRFCGSTVTFKRGQKDWDSTGVTTPPETNGRCVTNVAIFIMKRSDERFKGTRISYVA